MCLTVFEKFHKTNDQRRNSQILLKKQQNKNRVAGAASSSSEQLIGALIRGTARTRRFRCLQSSSRATVPADAWEWPAVRIPPRFHAAQSREERANDRLTQANKINELERLHFQHEHAKEKHQSQNQITLVAMTYG